MMLEFKCIMPDGHWGWVFAPTMERAYETAADYMGEFVTVIPTGRVI